MHQSIGNFVSHGLGLRPFLVGYGTRDGVVSHINIIDPLGLSSSYCCRIFSCLNTRETPTVHQYPSEICAPS